MASRKENKNDLYRELKRLSKKSNERIRQIEKRYGKNSWAVNNLKNRLDSDKLNAWTKTGRISIKNDYSIPQMRAVIKANELFLKSQTSTLVGIRHLKKKVTKAIQESLSNDKVTISDKEAENLYKILEDKDNRGIVDKLGGSTIFGIANDVVRKNDNKDKFLDKVKQYLIYDKEDKDTIDQLNNIYNIIMNEEK